MKVRCGACYTHLESCPLLHARQALATILDDYTFTCGASLIDLELTSTLTEVCVRDLQCYDPVEKLYYSMNYDEL